MAMSPRLLRPRSSAVFNPRTISGLGMWLDASQASSLTLNGNTVSEWRDLSGNLRNFAQASAASQPNATTRTQNGRTALDFTGSQFLSGNAAALGIARNVGGLSVIAVCKLDAVATDRSIFTASIAATAAARAYIGTGTTIRAGGRRADANTFASAASASATTAPAILSAVFDYANSDLFLFINGAQAASTLSFQTDGTTPDTNSNQVTVGTSGTEQFDGFLCELIVYSRAITSNERAAVNLYLSNKWGITLA